MTDIVERLRLGRETCGVDMCRNREARSGCTCAEAADEIERLREALRGTACDCELKKEVSWHEEENNRLREALHKARNTLGGLGFPKIASDICDSALEGKE